jgi:serine/threonine protein kinase
VENEPRYRFLQKLGEGGMGEVYLVEHLQLGRKEALKILRGDLARDQRFVLRFRREARATHRVQHPNIVAVHDFGRLGDGRFFLAMEYVEGTRLDVALKAAAPAPFAVPRALDLLLQLTGAVAHAHGHGVIHRDLKPSNLLLTQVRGAEVLKVLDFGIAKLMFPEPGDNTQLTLDGEVFGTPKYMAPELFIAGQEIDHRADIYALGCIGYELLTGQPPFVGRRLEVMDAHLARQPEPPSAKNSAIRPEVERLILRCLDKNPRKRLQSAHDLHLALELLIGAPPGGRKAPLGKARRDEETGESTFASDTRSETRSDHGNMRVTLNDVGGDAARAQHESAVFQAAEAVLALGHSGTELVFFLVDVKEIDHARAKIVGEQREVEERMSSVDQTARQRETALRFALAELAFDQGADPLTAPSDLQRVHELENKLSLVAAEHEREIAALTERGIALAAELAVVEEKRTALYAALAAAVDKAMARFGGEPSIAAVRERLRLSRAAGGR